MLVDDLDALAYKELTKKLYNENVELRQLLRILSEDTEHVLLADNNNHRIRLVGSGAISHAYPGMSFEKLTKENGFSIDVKSVVLETKKITEARYAVVKLN